MSKLLDHWKHYFKTIHAPAQFVEAGFYFALSAAMERRVWVSSGAHRIFANQFVLFVADAGVGKGLVTGVVDYVLRENKKPDLPDIPLITMGPTSGSYQRLVGRMAENSTICTILENGKPMAYPYSSAALVLDEFTSFFTEHAAEAVSFFCQVWTGNIPYERDTNNKGRLFIKNPILSMIAGTTPKNLQKLLKYDIVGSGLDRRMLVIYAAANEWKQFEIPKHTPEQLESIQVIIKHLAKLTKIWGCLSYTPEAHKFASDWWLDSSRSVVSHHPMLREYHGSKNALLHKLAIAVHMSLGEPEDMARLPITIPTVEEAARMLMSYERHRGDAWSESGVNHSYNVAMEISRHLKVHGASTKGDLYKEFYRQVKEQEFEEVMRYLLTSNRVRAVINGASITYEAI